MNGIAIGFMIIGICITWGGVVLSVANQMKNDALAEKNQGK